MNTIIINTALFGLILMASTKCIASTKSGENEKYVLVLDVQQRWTDGSLSKTATSEMISTINQIIEKTDPNHVIYVKSGANGYQKILSLTWKGFHIDSILVNAEFPKNLNVVSNHIFEKFDGNAFSVKEMTKLLEQNSAKDIILTGLLAEQCILGTTIGGISTGYNIIIVPEAIGSKTKKSKEKSIKKLSAKGAVIKYLNEL